MAALGASRTRHLETSLDPQTKKPSMGSADERKRKEENKIKEERKSQRSG